MALEVKNLPTSAGDMGLIPGLGGSPGEENGNPLQYSCLDNPMDTGAWWATVHEVAELDVTERLSPLHTTSLPGFPAFLDFTYTGPQAGL